MTLGALASIVPLALGLEALLGSPARATRALAVHLSVAAGIAQGAAAVAAVMYLRGPARAAGVRRMAEAIALALPAAAFAHALLVLLRGTTAALAGAPSALYAGLLLHVVGGALLALLGTAFVRASMAPDVAEALGSGEISGWLPAWIARAAPAATGPATARGLAIAYLAAYVIAAPIADLGALTAAGRAQGASLAGPFVLAADVFLALAVLAIVAALGRARHGLEHEIPAAHLAALAAPLALLSAALGVALLGQVLAAAGDGPRAATSLLPPSVSWTRWRDLAMPALVIGYLAPCVALSVRRVRENPTAVTRTAAVALLGAWLDRFSMALPPAMPGFGLTELASGVGFGALGACFVLYVLRKIAFPYGAPDTPLVTVPSRVGARS